MYVVDVFHQRQSAKRQTLASLADLQAIFDAVEVKTYERNDLNMQKRVGFIAQDLESALLGHEYFAHIVGAGTITNGATEEGEHIGEPIEETIKTVDYARLVVVLWHLQKSRETRPRSGSSAELKYCRI